MKYDELFTRYGEPTDHAEIDIRGYFTKPEKLATASEIKIDDHTAACLIQQCRGMIDALNEYRARLVIRYNTLETIPYHIRVTVKRELRYHGPQYFLMRDRVLEDGTEVSEYRNVYAGKERHQALKDWAAMCKQYPGCEAVKDIEKGKWER